MAGVAHSYPRVAAGRTGGDGQFYDATLRQLGASYSMTAGATDSQQALSSDCNAVSIVAVTSPIYLNINAAATSSSHYLMGDERIDIAVPFGAVLHVLRATSTDAAVKVSELK